MMPFYRKFSVGILVLAAILVALVISGHPIVNTTKSVPVGLWWVVDGPLHRGDIVLVPIAAFKSTAWFPEGIWNKNAWGKRKPFLKRVAGLPGEHVESREHGLICIDGMVVPKSSPLSADRLGRKMQAFALPVVLGDNEIWLTSDSPRGFDSRYLGPADASQCRKAIPILTF